jgi:hypothetical protein
MLANRCSNVRFVPKPDFVCLRACLHSEILAMGGGCMEQKQKAPAAPMLAGALSLGNAKGLLCTQ